jgi:hypothetical protein
MHGLTGLYATSLVIACSLIYNRELACGKGRRLDCCNVIAATRDFGMAIISLGKLYSCCLVASLLPMPHMFSMGDVRVVEL